MRFFTTALASTLSLSALVFGASTAEWRTRNIYFVLTDRIARGPNDNGGGACGDLGNYCGGTWAGLQGKLDYIQDMGFDAIWITPVVKNTPRGYHGYWASDLYEVNENYGSAQDLKNLVNAAHARGMYIMADIVANHMGDGDISTFSPAPLNQQSSYHTPCQIDYNNQQSIERCEIAGLPDIRTEDPAIRQLLQEWISWLVGEYGFDGLRLDTVKHIEVDFWPDFAWASGVYTVGEVWDGDPAYLDRYDNTMAGLLDYGTYYPMKRFYMQQGSSQELADMVDRMGRTFMDPTAMASFVDNHDNLRWLYEKGDYALFKNALAFNAFSRGLNIVYYGSEQGYSGTGNGQDPLNRQDLWRSDFNRDHDLYRFIQAVNNVKTRAGGLPGNDHRTLYVADTAYAWSREGGDLIVLTANGGSGYNREHCFNSGRANGSWNIVLGGSGAVRADGNGRICLTVRYGLPVAISTN